ncbi:uncharacterized protein PgNI_08088 [Pyricularia grisea]|uniref:Uncharacterized protein n=1 Tax=Pyricularia grisea TaxID=148305 RepID=A0A6P8AW12_PYRGI|nr:uncharacterized protein PgNI_08088 [Pyricularia grisea]TLD06426.1 hypothetical protein PgNI_08088 [Pyricularia grisea]
MHYEKSKVALLLPLPYRLGPDEVLKAHDDDASDPSGQQHGNSDHYDDGEPDSDIEERVPGLVDAVVADLVGGQSDLQGVEDDGKEGEDGDYGGNDVRQVRAPLRVDVEVGKLAAHKHGRLVDARQPQLAVLETPAHVLVADEGVVAKWSDEGAKLFVGREARRLGHLGDELELAGLVEVDLILDQVVIRPDEAQTGFVDIVVGVVYVGPELLAVHVGRDGLDVDALIVPDQVEARVLINNDAVAAVGGLVV